MTPRERLGELFARIDAFFEQAAGRFPGPSGITCHAGCADCCRRRFSVTALEAEVIAEGLASLAPEVREAMAARAALDAEDCPALEADGRCVIYPFRPVICRSHGLAIRYRAGGHDGGEPAVVMGVQPRSHDGGSAPQSRWGLRPAVTMGAPPRSHDGGSAPKPPPRPAPPRPGPAGPRSLPLVDVDACPKNFTGRDLASLPPDAVLDQTTVSTVLGALDAARADEAGRPRGERVDLATLLAPTPRGER